MTWEIIALLDALWPSIAERGKGVSVALPPLTTLLTEHL